MGKKKKKINLGIIIPIILSIIFLIIAVIKLPNPEIKTLSCPGEMYSSFNIFLNNFGNKNVDVMVKVNSTDINFTETIKKGYVPVKKTKETTVFNFGFNDEFEYKENKNITINYNLEYKKYFIKPVKEDYICKYMKEKESNRIILVD